MKHFTLFILWIINFEMSYCQDRYLQDKGITQNTVQKFCDSVSEKSYRLGYSYEKGFDTNIELGQGEFYYVNNDSCFLYDLPTYNIANRIAKLKFSDSVYVFKNVNGKPVHIWVAGDGFGGNRYYLCATTSGKLALFKDNDCVSLNGLSFSPNIDYYLTLNGFSSLLISKDWKRFLKLPTHKLFWYPDHLSFIYNDCNVDCNTNSHLLEYDLKHWKSDIVCKGVSPFFINNYNSILYFNDSVFNGFTKEYLFKRDLNRRNTELFYQIPDSLTYWHDGDDFRTPCEIKLNQFNGKTIFELHLWKRGSDYNGNTYIFYIDEQKKVVEIRII